MPFDRLFMLYASFLEGDQLQHEDLIQPIKDFAHMSGITLTNVVKRLQDQYTSS